MWFLKGLRGHQRIPGFSDLGMFRNMFVFFYFPVGFRACRGLQSIGNFCGIQINGFSAKTEPCVSIFEDFHDLGNFGDRF